MPKMIPKPVLEDVRFRNDIVEVIGSYLTLVRAGGAFKALCPFHKEKSPSFHINPQRQIFHCFGCGAGGDVFGFVMQHESVDFSTAVTMLANRVGIKLELEEGGGESGDKAALYRIHEGVASFFQRCLEQTPGAAHAREYMQTRALDATLAKNFLIGYAPDGWDAVLRWGAKHEFAPEQLEAAGLIVRNPKPESRRAFYDRFRNRLMFPIRDEQARVIGFSGRALDKDAQAAKYVNSPETLLFKKSRILYAIDRARRPIVDAGEAIVCEGQIDVIRCHAAGLENAVAAQGTAFTEDHARIVRRYADSVVLVFDPDRAGQDAAIRAAGVFMQAGLAVRVASLPAGQDPDAFIRSQGGPAFKTLLEQAASVVNFQIAVLSERENVRSDVGVMRISKALLQTIVLSPNAVLRTKLVQEAAAKLGIPATALLDDMRNVQARERRGLAPEVAPTASTVLRRQPEEVELCKHLIHLADEPQLGSLVRENLPLRFVHDPACRRIAEICLQTGESGGHLHDALESGPDVDPELIRFAAEVQSAPSKIRGLERSHSDAVRDIILCIWRRELRAERERLELAQQAAPSSEQAARIQQITLDLNSLKTWDHGVQTIALEMAE